MKAIGFHLARRVCRVGGGDDALPLQRFAGLGMDIKMSAWPRLLLLLVWLALPALSGAEPLRLVADFWPPFSAEGLPNGGVANELVCSALSRAGYASEFRQVPWARALHGLGEGDYDILINAWYDAPRTQVGQFSEAYLLNRIKFLSRKQNSINYAKLTDLYPFNIAVVRGYAYAPAFDNDPQLHKVSVVNFPVALQMLAAGRVDLTLEDEYVARYFLAKEAPELSDQLEFLPTVLGENQLRILVSLKNPRHAQIVADFDKAIAAMRKDGSYAAILRAHGM